MAIVAGSSVMCSPVNTETLALFEDNVDIFAHIELTPLPGLPSSEDLLSIDFGDGDIGGLDDFDRLFRSCIDRMASFTPSQTVASPTSLNSYMSSPPGATETFEQAVKTGTYLAPRTVRAVQESDNLWRRPQKFDCGYCSKTLFSKVAWHRHQVCHIKASMKCKRCGHMTWSLSAFRRHNEYHHGAKRKRHVFFDSC